MSELVFTFFDGPDAGRTFVLGDRPITLGRDADRDIVLKDDRASRLHARILPHGDGAIIADAGSSNGTFVNGALVRERKLAPGDVIVIGANSLVFGRVAPSPKRADTSDASSAGKLLPHAPGETTLLMGYAMPAPRLNLAPARLTELIESLAEAAQPLTNARGIHISIESDLDADTAQMDAPQAYRALAGLFALLLDQWPPLREPQAGDSAARTLVLRLGPDPARAGFMLEMICVGTAIPRERIVALGGARAIVSARRAATAHGGTLEILPADSPDILLRLRMPLGSPDADRPTRIGLG